MTSRRDFLAGVGAALIASPASPNTKNPDDGLYLIGLVANPTLAGPDGDLVFKIWASIASDGTGFGVLVDRSDRTFNSHFRVLGTERQGNRCRWQGVVTVSNDPRFLRQRIELAATVDGDAASPLELVLMGRTFSGRGLATTS